MFKINTQFIFGLLTAIVLAGGAYLVIYHMQPDTESVGTEGRAQDASEWGRRDVNVASDSVEESATTTQEGASRAQQVTFDNPKTFTHETRQFSFRYPENLRVGRFDQGDTEIIVVQNPNEQVGFQISIRSIDEEIAMTKQRIQEDLPDLQVRQPQPVQLGADAGQGLAFYSDNEAFGGDSREVWFTFNDHLYQISTYANLDPLLKQVLNSWTFQ